MPNLHFQILKINYQSIIVIFDPFFLFLQYRREERREKKEKKIVSNHQIGDDD